MVGKTCATYRRRKSRGLGLATFAFAYLLVGVARADQVVPTDRVTTGVTIRREADADSNDLGPLRPGDRLPFVRNVPKWREVELPNGEHGFVSKSWTHVIGDPPDAGAGLPPRQPDELRIHFLNIGAGTCTVVECPGPNAPPMILDCGSLSGTPTSMTLDETRDYIQAVLSQHTKPPNVVLSHADTDHYGWIAHVLEGTQAAHVWQGGDPSEYTKEGFPIWLQGQTSATLHRAPALTPDWHNDAQPLGADLDCGEASTFVLTVNSGTSKNAKSLVLLVEHEEFTAVFTGDAEGMTETRARSNFAGAVKATVLTGSHHGAASEGSNGASWATETSPEVIVFSAGRRFGHPRCDAVNRYSDSVASTDPHATDCGTSNTTFRGVQSEGKAFYMTEVDGRIIVTSNGQSPMSLHCTGSPGCSVSIPH